MDSEYLQTSLETSLNQFIHFAFYVYCHESLCFLRCDSCALHQSSVQVKTNQSMSVFNADYVFPCFSDGFVVEALAQRFFAFCLD